MSEKGSNSDSLEELNTNNNNNSVVATEESSQQVSPEEIERRKREAEELFKKYVLYFSTEQAWQEIENYEYEVVLHSYRKAGTVCANRHISFCLNTLIDYITSSENHFRKSSFKDFFDLRACDKNAPELPYKPFLPELPESKIPMNATFIEGGSWGSVASRIASMIKVPEQASEEQKRKISKIKQEVCGLVNYFELANTKISPRLYRRILRNYPNATHEQILIASVIYSYFPWYNKGSVFTYFSKEDLDKIYKILSYSFLINDSAKKEAFLRYSFRYLYSNRKDKSSDKFEKFKNTFAEKVDEIGLKPEDFSITNLNKFSNDEQEFITTWIKSLDFMEIIMDGNVASVNVVKNLCTYCKIYAKNPIEVIKNMKLAYKENHDGAELSNSDLHTLLNVDAIESLNKFENIINPEFLTVERIQQISRNENLKEIIVASLINNSFNVFAYNGSNYFPPNYLSQNPEFSSLFLIYSEYVVPCDKEISADFLLEIMNYVVNNWNDFISRFETSKEDAVDGQYNFFANLLGFKLNSNKEYTYDPSNAIYKLNSLEDNPSNEKILKIIAALQAFWLGFAGFRERFSDNLTLITISILENPSNITNFISRFDIDQLIKCINANGAYKGKLIEILSFSDLNTVVAKNILSNENIAKLYENENLKQKVIDEKRKLLPEDFDKEDLSDDLLSCLSESVLRQKELLIKLKDLNDIISELPNNVINWAIAKPDEIPVIKNIVTAQSVDDIEESTIQKLIEQRNDFMNPIFPFFVQKLLNKIPFNEIKYENSKVLNLQPLNNAIIKYADSKAGKGGLSTQEMNNLEFTLSKFDDNNLEHDINTNLYKNIDSLLLAEKETRDNEKKFIITQISKISQEKETRKEILYALCNGLILNNLDDIYYLNRLPSILQKVSQSFNEQETRSILLEASDPNYITTLVNEANNSKLDDKQNLKHPIELARSYSPQVSLSNPNPER